MLDIRSRNVLKAVVQSYIESPEPVGSRYITKRFEFGLSPATIRNIMADLEELGFLDQPHTSAGRIPTDRGYRFYVENLMQDAGREAGAADAVLKQLEGTGSDVDTMLRETTRIISGMSHYLAMATPPRPENSRFQRIEFISHRDDRIAVVLFTSDGLIRHKVIGNTLRLSSPDLGRLASFINTRCAGMTVRRMREELLEEMVRQKDIFDALIARAMELFDQPSGASGEGVFISGLGEVVNLPDFANIDKIRELSRAIEDKHAIITLIDRFLEEEGVQIVIGGENPVAGMSDMSLVASTYKESDRSVGVIGIIGPRRMNYQSAIVIVDTAARYISRMLLER